MKIKSWKKISILLFLFSFNVRNAYALPAFPGAEGMGADTVGGRGGTVYIVDTLSDNPADGMTFREAVTASGPRYVTFAVSGHIRLTSPLFIEKPYLTIAGQTSPGGVDVSGQMTVVGTHDVIITHMRFRMSSDVCDQIGPKPAVGNCETYGDTFRVSGSESTGDKAAYNVIIDHCSFSWGNDETFDIGGYNTDGVSGSATDTTLSNSIIAQGLDDPAPETLHGYGISIGTHFQGKKETKASLHNNYIAHFRLRLPQVTYNAFADLRNNVMYNWGQRSAVLMDEMDSYSDYTLTRLNAVANHFKMGPLGIAKGYNCSTNASGVGYYGSGSSDCIATATLSNWTRGQFYIDGNTGCANGRVWQGYSSSCAAPTYYPQSWLDQVSPDFMSLLSHPTTSGIPVTTLPMNDTLVDSILANAGATKPSRDSVDAGFVTDYYNTAGSTLADNHFPDNYPTFNNIVPPVDNDLDGMSDAWEISNLGSIAATANGDADSDGYENIEEYVHFLGEYVVLSDTNAPSAPLGLIVE